MLAVQIGVCLTHNNKHYDSGKYCRYTVQTSVTRCDGLRVCFAVCEPDFNFFDQSCL